MSGEFGTGKTIFVLAIVVGCFAVLWPKIFYPMLTASVKSPASARQAAVGWKNTANSEFLQQLCYLLEEHSGARWSHEADCWLFLESSCHLELNESMLQDYRLGKDKTAFTDCLGITYGLSPNIVAAAVPQKIRPRSYTPQSGSAHHVRPERPAHLYPEMMHPALREKGRQLPQRTVDKNPRPGPMPGMRPTMGGAGGIVPPPQGKGSGAMGIIMPLYTVGIVVFFVYTIMKVLFKKGSDDEKAPKLKDFGMDPEYRKYVFAEEYLDNQNISTKSEFRRQQREDSRQRKKMHEVPDTKIEDEQMDHLRRRLEDTETAMERLMNQMGSVTDKLTAAKITEVLSQAQAQAKILKIGLDSVMDSAAAAEAIYKAKDEAADLSFASEDDLTTSEALTTTMSDEPSFPSALHRHLQDLQVEQAMFFPEYADRISQTPTKRQPHQSRQHRVDNYSQPYDNESAPEEQYKPEHKVEFSLQDIQFVQIEQKELTTDVPDLKTGGIHDVAITGDITDIFINSSDPAGNNVTAITSPMPNTPKEDDNVLKIHVIEHPPTSIDNYNLKITDDHVPFLIEKNNSAEDDEDNSSSATETGADISELLSFADDDIDEKDGQVMREEPETPVVCEKDALPLFALDRAELSIAHDDSEGDFLGKGTQTGASLALMAPRPCRELSTQTEEQPRMAILGKHTSFQLDKGGAETRAGTTGPMKKINEIVMDALLPSETQLMIEEVQIGHRPMPDVEIEASEIEAVPCVVSGQLSLHFDGLEQRENSTSNMEVPMLLTFTPEVKEVSNLEPSKPIKQVTFASPHVDSVKKIQHKDTEMNTMHDTIGNDISQSIPASESAKEMELVAQLLEAASEIKVENISKDIKEDDVISKTFEENENISKEIMKCVTIVDDTIEKLKSIPLNTSENEVVKEEPSPLNNSDQVSNDKVNNNQMIEGVLKSIAQQENEGFPKERIVYDTVDNTTEDMLRSLKTVVKEDIEFYDDCEQFNRDKDSGKEINESILKIKHVQQNENLPKEIMKYDSIDNTTEDKNKDILSNILERKTAKNEPTILENSDQVYDEEDRSKQMLESDFKVEPSGIMTEMDSPNKKEMENSPDYFIAIVEQPKLFETYDHHKPKLPITSPKNEEEIFKEINDQSKCYTFETIPVTSDAKLFTDNENVAKDQNFGKLNEDIDKLVIDRENFKITIQESAQKDDCKQLNDLVTHNMIEPYYSKENLVSNESNEVMIKNPSVSSADNKDDDTYLQPEYFAPDQSNELLSETTTHEKNETMTIECAKIDIKGHEHVDIAQTNMTDFETIASNEEFISDKSTDSASKMLPFIDGKNINRTPTHGDITEQSEEDLEMENIIKEAILEYSCVRQSKEDAEESSDSYDTANLLEEILKDANVTYRKEIQASGSHLANIPEEEAIEHAIAPIEIVQPVCEAETSQENEVIKISQASEMQEVSQIPHGSELFENLLNESAVNTTKVLERKLTQNDNFEQLKDDISKVFSTSNSNNLEDTTEKQEVEIKTTEEIYLISTDKQHAGEDIPIESEDLDYSQSSEMQDISLPSEMYEMSQTSELFEKLAMDSVDDVEIPNKAEKDQLLSCEAEDIDTQRMEEELVAQLIRDSQISQFTDSNQEDDNDDPQSMSEDESDMFERLVGRTLKEIEKDLQDITNKSKQLVEATQSFSKLENKSTVESIDTDIEYPTDTDTNQLEVRTSDVPFVVSPGIDAIANQAAIDVISSATTDAIIPIQESKSNFQKTLTDEVRSEISTSTDDSASSAETVVMTAEGQIYDPSHEHTLNFRHYEDSTQSTNLLAALTQTPSHFLVTTPVIEFPSINLTGIEAALAEAAKDVSHRPNSLPTNLSSANAFEGLASTIAATASSSTVRRNRKFLHRRFIQLTMMSP